MTNYPFALLHSVTNLFQVGEINIQNTYLLACQHILEPQAYMFRLFTDFGIKKENIHIFGKIYSTSNEVYTELAESGFSVSKPEFNPLLSFDTEHATICRKELSAILSKIKSQARLIILDDGGELLKAADDYFDSIPSNINIVGIEQTSSGFRKLEQTNLRFPIFNVARSSIKLNKESPFIADFAFKRIEPILSQYNMEVPRILIVGLGAIGSNLLTILNNKKYFTLGYDIAHHDPEEIIDLIKNNNINVVIGATGTTIINEFQIEGIKKSNNHRLLFISMSSADREFPTTYIRKNGVMTESIHTDVTWDNIVLINNGFPITFKGNRNESPAEEIERTIALLYGSTLEAVTMNQGDITGFIDVPKKISDIL